MHLSDRRTASSSPNKGSVVLRVFQAYTWCTGWIQEEADLCHSGVSGAKKAMIPLASVGYSLMDIGVPSGPSLVNVHLSYHERKREGVKRCMIGMLPFGGLLLLAPALA